MIESCCSLSQVVVRDDIVAAEHARRQVAAQLHSHVFPDTRADEIPDRTPPKVVGNPTRTTGRHAGVLPRLGESNDGRGLLLAAAPLSNHPEEHQRRDVACALQGMALWAG